MIAPITRHRAPAILLTLLLHLGLFALWQMARHQQAQAPAGIGNWLTLITPWRAPALPAKPIPPDKQKHPAPAVRQRMASPAEQAAALPAAAPAAAPLEQATPEKEVLPVVTPLEKSGRSYADIMKQARRDLGKINHELQEADAKWVRAPVSSPHSRMQAAFDAAKDAVPPKWYEAARITEITNQGGNGTRIYKVVSAMGTYCISMASNHTLKDNLPKGASMQDAMSTGIKPTFATCPK
jgi:hypothetical protein